MSHRPQTAVTPITLYGLQTCSHCKSVRKFLRERRVPFQLVHVDMLVGEERNDTLRQLRRVNPSLSFPTLIVGDQTVIGFKPEAIQTALDALPHP